MTLSISTLYGFLLVLTRVAGVFGTMALPQGRNAPPMARVALAVGVALMLQPFWPSPAVDFSKPEAELWRLVGRLASEAVLGAAIGLVVALLSECFQIAAQTLGLQAGYSYASTIDPNSQADSGVLLVLMQLGAWMMFFALGLEAEVLRALARSLETHPAGTFVVSAEARAAVLGLGATVFSAGFRLALPVVALLLLVDIAFAVFGRLHAQLQLISLVFPVKMLVALLLLAMGMRVFPRVYEGVAASAAGALRQLTGS